jgi:hypothetical protein
MENFTKLIQAEWENIWDFVFGRDIDTDPAPTEPEIKTENEVKETQ